MRRWKRVSKIAAISLVGLVLMALVIIFGGSELILRRTYAAEARATLPASSRNVIEGQRLATLVGCNGCHERNLQGSKFFHEPNVATIYATNLTQTIPAYSDSDFEAAVRQGIRPDGTSVFGMPSASFAALKDEHLSVILSYVRSVPAGGELHPPLSAGLIGRVGLLIGQFRPETVNARNGARTQPFMVGTHHEEGRYLARIVCSECHGLDLKGQGGTPDLAIAGAYDFAGFRKLMRSGIGAGNRDLGLMSRIARGRFTSFTDQEIMQLHAYLVARAQLVPHQ